MSTTALPISARASHVHHASGAASGKVAAVLAHFDPRAAEADWQELEQIAPASAYQSRAWLLAWIEAMAETQRVRPLIIVARDAGGRPLCLLACGILKRGPLKLVEFLGGKDANFTFGLFRPGFAPDAAEMIAMLKEAAAQVKGGLDLFAFVNQPRAWNGAANPMLALTHQAAPSRGYRTALPADGEAYLKARLSRDSRKKYRQKEGRLAGFGDVSHLRARTMQEAEAILAAFHAQKAQRMKDKGIGNVFDRGDARAFLRKAAVDPLTRSAQPAIELHALKAGEKIVATFAGAPFQGRFSGMFNSFDQSEQLARCSPGDLLLIRILSAKCAEGFTAFDLGVGEARYKRTFCDETEELFDAYVPMTLAGRLLKQGKAGKRRLKGWIKHNPRVWALVERLRKLRS